VSPVLRGVKLGVRLGALRTSPLPAEAMACLQEAQVTVSSGARGGFQLKFAMAKNDMISRDLLPGNSLDPPNRVVLLAYVDGTRHVLMDGVITRHDLAPSNEAGQSTLTVTGVDVSQMMDLIDMSGLPQPAMPREAKVAIALAPFVPLYGVVPAIVPSLSMVVPNPLREIPAMQGTHYAFISQLADEVGYVFYVEPAGEPEVNIAYWGPEVRAGSAQPALSVNMDAATNVESLSFSFDGLARKVHLLLGHIPEVHTTIPVPLPDVSPLNPMMGKKFIPPLSYVRLNAGQAEYAAAENEPAKRRREDALAKHDIVTAVSRGLARAAQSGQMITGSGSLDVLRYGRPLQARRLVAVRGAGKAYDGQYYVKSVTSTLKPGAFTQRFSLSRNAQISSDDRVTP
jgi:hypothetical protein